MKGLVKFRQERGEPYLLVDIGDHMDRSHFITEASEGQANIDLLQQLEYDYITIGNNEGVTFNHDQLSSLYRNTSFQVVINNLYEAEGRRPSWCLPHVVSSLGEYKVGIIGTTVDYSTFYHQLGWQIEDPFQAVARSLRQLRGEVDFIILLSHLGLQRDRQLAERFPELDLILGAHTHHFLPHGLKVGRTWVHQVGMFGRYVGRVQVYYETHEGQFRCYPRAEAVEGVEVDQDVAERVQNWAAWAEKELARQVTCLDQSWEIDWHEETPLGNLLAEAVNHWCDADVALVNTGLILDRLPQGEITLRDIHRICPHPINACRLVLTGREIWSILKRSISAELQQLEIRGFGFRGKKLGMLAVDGLRIEYTQGADGSIDIINIYTTEGRLELQKTYAVATADMFTFFNLFPEIYEKEEINYFLPDFLRDLLAARLQEGNLERAEEKRWIKLHQLTQEEA